MRIRAALNHVFIPAILFTLLLSISSIGPIAPKALCAAEASPAAEKPAFLNWAQTPPMGWNSWDCFATTVTEAQTKAQADFMGEKLAPYGWQYIVVDIQWYEPGAKSFDYRKNAKLVLDQWGRLLPAVNRFPSAADGTGFKPLGDYIHGKGLKFGVHLLRGIPRQAVEKYLPIKDTKYHAADIADKNDICPWNPDMYGVDMTKPGAQEYYNSVFDLFAQWGVDFVKVDDISRPYDKHRAEIEAVRKAIDQTGRPMVLSLSPGETALSAADHVAGHANLWRISDDFWDKWELLLSQFERLNKWSKHIGPGHWPDADMLPLGIVGQGRKTNLTQDEQYTLMTLWAIARSPLIFGGDMSKMDDFTLSLLTNEEVIGVDQRSAANRQLFRRNGLVAWIADVPGSSDKYLAVFNIRNKPAGQDGQSSTKVPVKLADLGLSGPCNIRDLWKKTDLGQFTGEFTPEINWHGAGLYRVSASANAATTAKNWMPLDGQWHFALDPKDEGANQKWFETDLNDQIRLPGTTDENRKGSPNAARETEHLTRAFPYIGAAWYQRDIDIPSAWSGKRIALFLERTKTTRLWLDGKDFGEQNSLVAPHEYSLGVLTPGKHRLTLMVDNKNHPPIGDPHQISDHTQTNWNGVIGRIGLKTTDQVWIDDVQIYPMDLLSSKTVVRVKVRLGNATGKPGKGKLLFNIKEELTSTPSSFDISWNEKGGYAEFEVPFGDHPKLWDEFQPALNVLNVKFQGDGKSDQQAVTFGIRNFTTQGTQFSINGRPTFLRGKHDACVFPLTGYSPMNVDDWLRVFKIAKTYGINHYRFHSWCPPEAAFQAADQLGIYLQVELPNWTAFGPKEHDDFMRAEGERILRYFGNHPSFVMLSLGNELGGKQELMAPFIKHFRELDARHLYAQGSNNWFPKPDKGDDFLVSFQVNDKKVRGSFATVDPPLAHVQLGPPSTEKDYSAEIAAVNIPVVGHEVGQYQVAPDLRELNKYTGVLKSYNYALFLKRLADKGMTELHRDFLRASGALSVICYREDIEAALRTRGFGGFQLLDLQDFPGQGTALVGILNAFMESKGLIDPAKWRQFCCETVPLVLMPKYTWTQGETFKAKAEVAHYGPSDIDDAIPAWTLRDSAGVTLNSGRLPKTKISQGTVTSLGNINIPLNKISAPSKLSLELALTGTNFKNSYDIWVYPDTVDTAPGKVIISREFDDNARQALAKGGSVLLMPDPVKLTGSIEGSFAPDFWNFGMFKKFAVQRNFPVAPGTLGILCDPKHPAFETFPTDFHGDWQWFYLLKNSRAVILDSMPDGYRPTLQVIDNYERLHKLGSIFEIKVGPGKLLVCSIDLPGQQDKPEARQLLHSLLSYMNSDEFNPTTTLDEATIQNILQMHHKETEHAE